MSKIISDIHIHVDNPINSLLYPGPRIVTEMDMPLVRQLLERIALMKRDDFTLELDGNKWRGQRDPNVVDGEWFRMRKIPDTPTLQTLPSPLTSDIQSALLSPAIQSGGIIHICGQPGSGKTTTASATAVSRLLALGGHCYGMEDPVEYSLNGWHGPGYFTQTWVDDWDKAMKVALRCQPAATDLMMYVGEIRDANTARMMIRAASNGFLVISTGFGSDLVSGIDTFSQILGADFNASFANAIRIIVHQKIEQGTMKSDVLISSSPTSEVSIIIRSGHFGNLRNEIDVQRTARRLGNMPSFKLGA